MTFQDTSHPHTETGEPIAWEASEKQAEFLACEDYEVLFGGAAGGGKSDALLIDAWCSQYDGPLKPKHRAIIFRRSYPELKDLIDRSLELYPTFLRGAKYNKNEHIWKMPSGASVEFGYLNNDADRFKHRGKAYNYIGFDELTLWATSVCYEYLITRNRTVDRTLPCMIRATTNPDGVGQKWVMERWGIEEEGNASRIETQIEMEIQNAKGDWVYEPRTIARCFIPAKLVDNIHLRGTGYRERLMLMAPDVRDALLKGLWTGNKVFGAIYFKELQKMRAEGRCGRIPHQAGVPVNTFWDLGWNDFNSIWFHQAASFQNRFIHAYQNSGEWLDHYAAYLSDLAKERGYVWGTHYLPHDAKNKTIVSRGKDAITLLRELMPGQRFVIVPRVERLVTGIQQTRSAMASCFIDDTPEGCADGIASLGAYRWKFNKTIGAFTDEHIHDSHSNYADAFRQFAQGFDKAQVHIAAAEPEWKKRLRIKLRGKTRHPMTA